MNSKNLKKPEKSTAAASPTSQPSTFIPYAMDSTPHIEISFMGTSQYSAQLIRDAEMTYDLQKLQTLKSNKNTFLNEGKRQINILCQKMESLQSHTDMFIVTFLVRIGILLEEIESSFRHKSKYDAWIKNNFATQMRYFQQARQLARMGDFALQFRSLGKNRLLEFDRLRKSTENSFEDILRDHPFPDTTKDMGGKLSTEHIDGIITYYRFKKAGVDLIDFDQAALMAAYHHGSIEVKIVEKIKGRLEQEQNKEQLFEDYVMDKMRFPEERKSVKVSWESLNMLLAAIVDYRKKVNIEDGEWIKRQREILSESLFTDAFGFLSVLKDKWEINIVASPVSKPPKEGIKK